MRALLIIIFIFFQSILESKSQVLDSISIEIRMPSKTIIKLRYANDQNQTIPLTFRNNKDSDEVVINKIFVNKPTIFDYKVILQKENDKVIEHYILGNPNTVVKLILDSTYNIKYQDTSLFSLENQLNTDYKNLSLIEAYNKYTDNSILFDNLVTSGKLNNNYKLSVQIFSELIFLDYIGRLQYSNVKTTNKDEIIRTIQSIENLIDKHYKFLNSISSNNLFNILVNLKLKLSNRKNTLINAIKEAQSYNDKSNLINVFIERKLDFFPEKSTLEYKEATEYLKINDQIKLSQEILELNLLNPDNHSFTIIDELENLPKSGILILDFWASWCSPCIAEFSSLLKLKDELANLPVSFVPINMDTEENVHNWLRVSSEHNYILKNKNYRVSNDARKKLYKFFNIKSIPRYIALDKNGKVINANFPRPSELEFKSEIENYLKLAK